MFAIRTILHPTDFSDRSGYAFQVACALARDYGARLIVLHADYLPVALYGEVIAPPRPEGYREKMEEQLHQLTPPDHDISNTSYFRCIL